MTEQNIMVLRFDVESAYALETHRRPGTDDDWQRWLDESLSAVQRITEIMKEFKAPATFFMVGLLLDKAGEQYARLLAATPLADIESHTYSHCAFKPGQPAAISLRQLEGELEKTEQLIEKFFGKRPMGFCAPGNYVNGLQGCPEQLGLLWKRGYRFTGTDGVNPADNREKTYPAPFKRPYWYENDGFPRLLEIPITGWHCNMLLNSGGQNTNWRKDVGFPDGGILEKLPVTEAEAYQVRKRELEYALANHIVYSPCMHPWSIYRFGKRLEHFSRLVETALAKGVTIMNCFQLYELLAACTKPTR